MGYIVSSTNGSGDYSRPTGKKFVADKNQPTIIELLNKQISKRKIGKENKIPSEDEQLIENFIPLHKRKSKNMFLNETYVIKISLKLHY